MILVSKMLECNPMTGPKSAILIGALAFLVSVPTKASTLVRAPNGVGVLDTLTDLEWLPLSSTDQLSYNQITMNPVSPIASGYTIATDVQVLTLMRDAGFPSPVPKEFVTIKEGGDIVNTFFTLFGIIDTTDNITGGLSRSPDFAPCGENCLLTFSATAVYGPSSAFGPNIWFYPDYFGINTELPAGWGWFLFKVTPEPATTTLCCIGLIALISVQKIRNRSRRANLIETQAKTIVSRMTSFDIEVGSAVVNGHSSPTARPEKSN